MNTYRGVGLFWIVFWELELIWESFFFIFLGNFVEESNILFKVFSKVGRVCS